MILYMRYPSIYGRISHDGCLLCKVMSGILFVLKRDFEYLRDIVKHRLEIGRSKQVSYGSIYIG